MPDKLQQALTAYKANDKPLARQLVASALKDDPDNADAWYMAAYLTDDKDKQAQLLDRALRIDPDHVGAKETLQKLRPDLVQDPLDRVIEEEMVVSPEERRDRRKLTRIIVMLVVVVILAAGLYVGYRALAREKCLQMRIDDPGLGALISEADCKK